MDDSVHTTDEILARREFDTEQNTPATQIVELVADLEDSDPVDLPPIYNCIDGMIADLFSTPPPMEAEARLQFTYQGYRFDVRQDGRITVSA